MFPRSPAIVESSIVFLAARNFFLAFLVPCCASGYEPRVRDDRLDKASVADEKRYDKEIVEQQDCSSRSRSRLYKEVWRRVDEVVYPDHFCDHICAVTDETNEDDRYDSCDPCISSLLATSSHDLEKRMASPRSRCGELPTIIRDTHRYVDGDLGERGSGGGRVSVLPPLGMYL
jgi:hypothetical protein